MLTAQATYRPAIVGAVESMSVRIYVPSDHANEEGTLLYFYGEGDGADRIARELGASCGTLPILIALSGEDWNRDLSPWPAPRVFKDGDDFSGGAEAHLEFLTTRILPACEEQYLGLPKDRSVLRGLAGYSLAGLFAAWAPWHTDAFSYIASVSGSLWYDGFMEYVETTPPVRLPSRCYLSVGDREKKTRNPRMAAVEDCTKAFADLMRARDAEVCFELNPGNHFAEPEHRLARGLLYLI